MRKFLFVILTGTLFLFSGCLDDDGYSLDKMYLDFGVIEKFGDGDLEFLIRADGGEVLYPTSAGYIPLFENGSRVMINYTIIGDKKVTDDEKEYWVIINSINKILKKGILDLTVQNQDSIGNDPVRIVDHWMANNLLNFKLKYYGESKTHFINLVKQPGAIADAQHPIDLELRHNSNGDSETYPFTAYVSFDLSAIKVSGLDSVRFKVSATDYEGDILSFYGVYNYNGSN